MEIVYNFVYYASLLCFPFLIYFLMFRKTRNSIYSGRDWFYLPKLIVSKREVKEHQEKYRKRLEKIGERLETEIFAPALKYIDTVNINGIDEDGNSLSLKIEIGIDKIVEASLHLRLKDGNNYVFPGKNGTVQTTLPRNVWKVAGLNVDILEPFRRLRITFNGLLKNISCTDYEKVEHVQFNFIFTSFCSPHYFPQDIDTSLFARALASDHWRDGSWRNNMISQYGFEQLGALKGFVKGDSYTEEQIMNLTGNRCRCKGVSDRFLVEKIVRIIASDEYGNLFNIITKSLLEGTPQLNYGFALLSDEKRYPITDIDIQLSHIGVNKAFPDCIKTNIVVNNRTYNIVVYLNKNKLLKSTNNTEYGYEYYTVPANCNIDLNSGSAIVEFWYRKEGEEVYIPKAKLSEKNVENLPDKLIIDIRDEESQILDLTGGKGNSLGLLSSLNLTSFTVPEGFIITVKAHSLHLSKNADLTKSLQTLKDTCCGKHEGDLQEACNKIVDAFKNDTINPDVRRAIINQLKNYQTDSEFLGWAVRSSAIGEDSDELSAAGQNETFLGCQNEDEILKNVLACWASLYTYQSVQYRWQHGLPVITDMAVVVQKMVKADAAGVLFTCHPSTSNPSQMVITSNFGLGETVVSGESDPDTFILNRTWDEKICVIEKTLGSKNKVLKVTTMGLEETTGNTSHQENWSITDNQAIELGKVGVLLEQAFGNPRDIEWAFYNDKLYLLQSRAITTLNTWSDFEISHEMDTPLRTKKTFFTTANIREVIPKAVTVLSQSSSVLCTDWALQKFAQQNFDPLSNKGLITYQHNTFIDVIVCIHRMARSEVHISGLILDLAIFGHPVLNEEINNISKTRYGVATASMQLKNVSRIMINAWRNIVRAARKLVDNLDLNTEGSDDVVNIYKKITNSLVDLEQVAIYHSATTAVSVFYQIISMNIMLEGKTELTTEHISDFASILSSCEDVISAEVPKYLVDIAKIINLAEYTEQFCNLNPSEGVYFLKNQCHMAYELFCEFMDKHGHRSLNEFEMMEPSWKENPSLIISMIQANVRNERTAKKEVMSLEDIAKNLKSPKKNSTRYIIKFLVKRIRVAVGLREHTKSEMIRGYDKLRQAYRHLGQTMVHEGLIPSKDLIYHLTHKEIGALIKQRNPGLITKSIRRKKLYPSWRKLEFAEIMPEYPKAEDNDTFIPIDSVTGICKGTPVCTGVVQARACVIKSLDEINQLQTGDILITYSTDIGWSPYFPMLTGIVTELGGLVSHGAVVAREYGLPCIVGVQNVTKYFKTGDIVQLNGNKGELGKI